MRITLDDEDVGWLKKLAAAGPYPPVPVPMNCAGKLGHFGLVRPQGGGVVITDDGRRYLRELESA